MKYFVINKKKGLLTLQKSCDKHTCYNKQIVQALQIYVALIRIGMCGVSLVKCVATATRVTLCVLCVYVSAPGGVWEERLLAFWLL